jgi:putative two-component system response regulator
VDDSELNRDILSSMLGDEYQVVEATNGSQAIAILQRHSVSIDLVLLDVVMPGMDGYEVLSIMNQNRWMEDIPVIMISSENSLWHIERAYQMGVTDYISRPFDAFIVRRRVDNTLMLYAKQRKLVDMVSEQIYEKEKNNSMMIDILSHIVEFRNGESGLHILHVKAFTEILLKRVMQLTDQYHLTYADVTMICNASALHDIGKISIPDEILNKPGKLTREEFEIMKTHSAIGANMLKEIDIYKDEPMMKVAHEICRWHHERYDGNGYPDGLKGDEIPISAQIVSLADVYDALTSKRVYKKAFSHEVALKMIFDGECGAFNPMLLQCLRDTAADIKKEMKKNPNKRSNERKLKTIATELIHYDELSSSERILHLLTYEQLKNDFFTTQSQRILFEYTADPPLLSVSPYGVKHLNIDEVTLNPVENDRISAIIPPEDAKRLMDEIHKTTPEQSVTQLDCTILLDDQPQKVVTVCKSIWSDGITPRCTGVIGEVKYAEDDFAAPKEDKI